MNWASCLRVSGCRLWDVLTCEFQQFQQPRAQIDALSTLLEQRAFGKLPLPASLPPPPLPDYIKVASQDRMALPRGSRLHSYGGVALRLSALGFSDLGSRVLAVFGLNPRA